VTEYVEQFPEVKVELLLTDRLVDLIEEGFDIALRAGPAGDSTLAAKRMEESGLALVAAPIYVKNSVVIEAPQDLPLQMCLFICPEQNTSSFASWNLISSGGKKAKVVANVHISSNSVAAVKHLAVVGQGVALHAATLVHNEISGGRLGPHSS
jgi:DNA-binding transcriptional LysR family regulator